MATMSRSNRARAAVSQLPRSRSSTVEGLKLLPSGRALIVGFGIVAAVVLAYVAARETSMFAVRSIDVSGAPPRVSAHVRAALQPLEGRSLLALSAADVQDRLDRLPDVAAVTYDRSFPHTLRVVVVPAHSVAVLRRGAAAWVVSSSGRVVRSVGPRAAPRLPRIWLPATVDLSVGNDVSDAEANAAITALAVARRAGFGERIRMVRAHNELTFVLASGLELRFGDSNDLAAKLAVARTILPRVGGAGYLDISAPDRPVAAAKSKDSG